MLQSSMIYLVCVAHARACTAFGRLLCAGAGPITLSLTAFTLHTGIFKAPAWQLCISVRVGRIWHALNADHNNCHVHKTIIIEVYPANITKWLGHVAFSMEKHRSSS